MFKKMKLISEDEYKRLKEVELQKPPTNVTKRSFSDKQYTADKILQDNDIPDDIKAVMYSQILRKLVDKLDIHLPTSKESITPKSTVTESNEKASPSSSSFDKLLSLDKTLLKAIPQQHRGKAEHIVMILRRRPDLISWDASGVCNFNGVEEQESNIIDLLNYTITSAKWKKVPAGINRFLKICKDLNISSSVVSAKLKHEFLRGNLKPRGNRLSSEKINSGNSSVFGWQSYANDQEDEEETFGTASDDVSE